MYQLSSNAGINVSPTLRKSLKWHTGPYHSKHNIISYLLSRRPKTYNKNNTKTIHPQRNASRKPQNSISPQPETKLSGRTMALGVRTGLDGALPSLRQFFNCSKCFCTFESDADVRRSVASGSFGGTVRAWINNHFTGWEVFFVEASFANVTRDRS